MHTIQKQMIHLDAKPVTLSDHTGFIFDAQGITQKKLDYVKKIRGAQSRRSSKTCPEHASIANAIQYLS